MLSVVMLSIIYLSVVAPQKQLQLNEILTSD
jgi:hypothetical protein